MGIVTRHYSDKNEPKSLGITGATVGQIARITAVDESGKPTAWSPVDMPSGGETWELLDDYTATDALDVYQLTSDAQGNPLSLKAVKILVHVTTYLDDKYTFIKAFCNDRLVIPNSAISANSQSLHRWYACEARLDDSLGLSSISTGTDGAPRAIEWKTYVSLPSEFSHTAITKVGVKANDGGKKNWRRGDKY